MDSDSSEYDFEQDGRYETPNQAPQKATELWDAFQEHPPAVDSGSEAAMVWVRRFEKLMLLIAFLVTFAIIITGTVVGKGVTMFMIAQVSPVDLRVLPFCNQGGQIKDKTKDYEVERDRQKYADSIETEQVAWIWCLFFAFAVPEVLTFLRALRVLVFKHWVRPSFLDFLFVMVMETMHVIGMAILVFLALPQIDTTHALALTNCLAVVPGILLIMSRNPAKESMLWLKLTVDALAILAQLSGALTWPILQWTKASNAADMKYAWAVPLGIILTSMGWWECFVSQHSRVPFVQMMNNVRLRMIKNTRYFTYIWISLWKLIIFFLATWVIVILNGVLLEPMNIFNKFVDSFGLHGFNVTEVEDQILGDTSAVDGALETRFEATLMSDWHVPLNVLLIQLGCSYGTYIFAKFACKVQIQEFSFALPLCTVVPTCMTLVLMGCGFRASNVCAFHDVVPDYVFYECPAIGDYLNYLWDQHMWLWVFWFLSQLWITLHIWSPESTRLASTEEIFASPMYNALFIDQSLILNRRRDGNDEFTYEDFQEDRDKEEFEELQGRLGEFAGEEDVSKKREVKAKDRVTKIYGCATMWHETKDEMIEMLKSIFRVDRDYSNRKIKQDFLKTVDKDFYEWETHIFFDDAFEPCLEPDEKGEKVVNSYVKLLVRVMDEAASFVHGKQIKVKPPKKYPTPHGGRLVWTLPGKTKIHCHLKDKKKILAKKRWSQCMYMYYLLGFKLMELPISEERKEARAQNTYVLALDGDIDFQANAVTRLVDLMKKNKNLGAACGRIHPTGNGFMVWYQRFEYAIGHWLQKSTEHVLGCVLCSPGCFSLFRAEALMDDNVMKKYTTKSEKARDFVQFDQGEDRWLCTLLLQRGWRVEYSAASDAFTACPEGFDEFYKQRRRWMPSTIANIFDVLSDYKNVTAVNDDISIFYVAYQVMMMVGTVLGPGTIFLMIVGAFTAAFGISNWNSFLINLIPILAFMLVCFTLDSKIQLFMAQILSAIYALIMMAVLVGIMLQIREDGFFAPTTLSIVLVGGSFILAAIVHPQEFWCLPYGLVYYITIPSMYLLLVIYSIFNMNVVTWGTREGAKKVVDPEAEEKRQEELQKEVKKQKKDGGLLGFLMQQTGKSEKGGLEFSLANLFKCMCFTHEEANDPKTQLIKIATSLEEVNSRLGKIEHGSGGGSGGLGLGFRRRSSTGRRQTRGSFGNIPLRESAETVEELTEGAAMPPSLFDSETDSDMEDDESVIKRVADVNPYWIEDRELGKGQTDFLKGVEIQFWKDLIDRYLSPPVESKENEEKQAKQTMELKDLRNQMVFSFFMLNSVFVVVIFLLQQQKDLLFIRWPLGAKANVTYIGPKTSPVVEVDYEFLELEPIGVVFVIFFAFVLVLQIIGMLFHRWGTMSQIISTTSLKSKSQSAEEELNHKFVKFVDVVQNSSDKDRENTDGSKRDKMGRRNTVHNLLNKQNQRIQNDAPLDLEMQFKRRLSSIQLDNPNNHIARRLSMRRETVDLFERRKSVSFLGQERRGSAMMERRMSQMSSMDMSLDPGVVNEGMESDDSFSDGVYASNSGSLNFETIHDEDEYNTEL